MTVLSIDEQRQVSENLMRMYGRQKGFTIIELMTTLAIMAVMMSMAAPSFTKMIRTARLQGASASLMGAFNMTRAEAIRRGKVVSICAVDDPAASPPVCGTTWQTGWVIFLDADGDDAIDTGEEFRIGDPMSGVVVDASGAADLVKFNARGQPTAGMGQYLFNAESCTSGSDKQFTISLGTVGRSRSTLDYDNDGTEDTCP